MAEQTATDKYVGQVRSFTLPPEVTKSEPPPAAPPPEAKPATEAVATPPAPEEETDKETTGKDPEKQSTRRFERRIDRATRRAAEAQARADLLERELAKVRQVPQTEPGAPRMDQFTNIEEYATAREKWGAERAVKEHETARKQALQKATFQKITQDWETKANRGLQKYDDFDEVVGELKPNSAWAYAVMEEENGDEIAYYLGKHIKEAQKIASLPPPSQIREIAKLALKLSATPEAPKKPSKAPPPINPVTETSQPSGDLRPNMSFEEYRKWGDKTFRGR